MMTQNFKDVIAWQKALRSCWKRTKCAPHFLIMSVLAYARNSNGLLCLSLPTLPKAIAGLAYRRNCDS